MKNVLLATAATFGLATMATAGNPDTPPIVDLAPVAPVAAAMNWTGFYAGGMANFDSGQLDYFLSDVLGIEADFLASNSFGGFVGYNKQVNALVFGGELAYSTGDMGFDLFTESFLTDRVDVKARVGYSFGQAMVYGVLGYSWATFDDVGALFPGSGMNYGAGVDYMVTDRIFVGAEYLIRDIVGEVGPERFESSLGTLGIRAGMNF